MDDHVPAKSCADLDDSAGDAGEVDLVGDARYRLGHGHNVAPVGSSDR